MPFDGVAAQLRPLVWRTPGAGVGVRRSWTMSTALPALLVEAPAVPARQGAAGTAGNLQRPAIRTRVRCSHPSLALPARYQDQYRDQAAMPARAPEVAQAQ